MAKPRHANGEQEVSFLKRTATILQVTGAALTALALFGLIVVAVIQNSRMQQVTDQLKAQQDYIERTVTQSNKRGQRTVDIIDAICRATVKPEDMKLCDRPR